MTALSLAARATGLVAATALCVSALSFGHGGTYRGPGDTVPPGSPPGGPTGGPPSGGPMGGPSTGPNGGPITPTGPTSTPGQPGGPRNASTPTGQSGPDLTEWTFWWEFNKDPYLSLKDSIHQALPQSGSDGYFIGQGGQQFAKDTLRPSDAQVRGEIVPALMRTLQSESNNDIVTGSLIALAKIGDQKSESGESPFTEVILPFLRDANQEIRETAAVSLGILANDATIPVLVDLLWDTEEGRALTARNEVNYRTRAFAAYALGLLGARTPHEEARVKIHSALVQAFEDKASSMHDVKVACVIAMGLVPLERIHETAAPESSPAPSHSRAGQIEYLLALVADEAHHHLVRAHAPWALTHLLAGLPAEDHALYKQRVAETLLAISDRNSKAQNELQQSAILALGQLGDDDTDAIDVAIRERLMGVEKVVKDQSARRLALISLAQVNGRRGDGEQPERDAATKHLLLKLAKGNNGMDAWAGLALGVQGYAIAKDDRVPSSAASAALRSSLEETRSGIKLGAYAIALGLLRDPEAKDRLLAIVDSKADERVRGYACIALGLLGARDAVQPIEAVVERSKYSPELLQQAAIALGLMGEKSIVASLTTMLEDAGSLSSQAALASALGTIGDRNSVAPLLGLLEDQEVTATARGFAAAALGIVADKETLPWNAKISVDLNYLAATPTLNDPAGVGILNLL